MSISEGEEKKTGNPLIESTAQMTGVKLKTRPWLVATEAVTSADEVTPLRKDPAKALDCKTLKRNYQIWA